MTQSNSFSTKKESTLKNGNIINKATQFGQPGANPRHNGAWKKEDTPRYKLEKMMNLEEDALQAIAIDKTAPYFERKLAICIKKGQWKEIKEMIEQVYGKAAQSVDVTTNGKDLPTPILGGIAKDVRINDSNQEDS